MALSGDDVAVGAPGESSASPGVDGDPFDDSLSLSGAVYLFRRSGAVWSPRAYIKQFYPGEWDALGEGVALDGRTLVMGAPGEDGRGPDTRGDPRDDSLGSSGAAYVRIIGPAP